MADPVGLIGASGAIPDPGRRAGGAGASGAGFKNILLENLKQVNELQQDATRAIEDLQTGQRDDVEGVILATQKADNAFRMLQAVRNKVVEAYEEVKQMRM